MAPGKRSPATLFLPGHTDKAGRAARHARRMEIPTRFGQYAGMSQPFPKIPKVREYAEITLADGTVMSGYFFVEATMRIQDLLNGPLTFLPFVDQDEHLHLLNKHAITRARPFD